MNVGSLINNATQLPHIYSTPEAKQQRSGSLPGTRSQLVSQIIFSKHSLSILKQQLLILILLT